MFIPPKYVVDSVDGRIQPRFTQRDPENHYILPSFGGVGVVGGSLHMVYVIPM